MNMCALVLVLVSFLTAPFAQADIKYQLYQKMLRRQAELNHQFGTLAGVTRSTDGTFDQIIDHFPQKKKAQIPTFKQRYFIDSSYAKDQNSPVIYYICGESTCEGASSTALVNSLARKYRAHRVALEHRYYGYSQPFATLSPSNLRYLTMAQAIEDLAYFQRYLQSQLGLKGKWISVGGSYPGELSAFYRLKHPELVVGALASSAPVYAKADFFEYDRHVARVAGPACLSVIQKVVSDVESKLKSPNTRAEVKRLFGATQVDVDTDFLYNLADMAAIAIQYGFQTEFCGALLKADPRGEATEAYAKVGQSLFQRLGTSPFQDSFQGAMSIDPKDYLESAGRQWMYQSCNEFGFYQIANANPAESSRSGQITLQYHNEACDRLFGIKAPVNTVITNQYYYAQLFQNGVNHIYFTNGSNDPWSNLSLTDAAATANANPGLNLFLIPGASHCEDLGSRITSALSQARTQFDSLFQKWISE